MPYKVNLNISNILSGVVNNIDLSYFEFEPVIARSHSDAAIWKFHQCFRIVASIKSLRNIDKTGALKMSRPTVIKHCPVRKQE